MSNFKMKAIIIYGSPRHKKSASYHLGYNFGEGLKRAGVEVEEIMLCKQKINHCQGCFTCWTKTPGVCIHKDDMVENLAKLREAELAVYATPLYIYHVPGLMKDFLDRSLPLVKPDLVERNGITSHPRRENSKLQKVFLISVAGFPEVSHFDALKLAYKKTFRSTGYIGEILIGGADGMSRDENQNSYKELYNLVEKAGFEVAKNGFVSIETQKMIADETHFTDKQIQNLRGIANKYWDSLKPKDYSQIKIEVTEDLPLKVTDEGMASYFVGMAAQYNPKALPDLKCIIQYILEKNLYYLIINDNECKAYEGTHPDPTLTIIAPTDIWMKISTGEIKGAKAFMDGLYKIEGDMGILMKLDRLFSQR
ncbi:MAG: NAD(P)H-dependent oxidoreductase [Promethearchaeota archaeon]